MAMLILIFALVYTKITLHVVPHSHCDPGWLWTTDEYFEMKVKPIIDRCVDYLMTHKDAKYNWVESIFLHMWWNHSTHERRENLLHLIHDTKQWQIVMGGWVMNDQACVTYGSSIEQLTLGHTWLMKEIGVTPREGFTLDPFGVSETQTYLYFDVGFDYHVVNRIPYQTKADYINSKSLEFYWKDSNELEDSLFTKVLYNHYDPPGEFRFWSSGTKPVTKDNIEKIAGDLVGMIKSRSAAFLNTEHQFLPYGDDFAYTCPDQIYGNMSLLINYINADPVLSEDYYIKYSTVEEYFDAIIDAPVKYPTISDRDYWVYDDNPNSEWSGYFVSQPRMKIKAREGERIARLSEFVFSYLYYQLSPYYSTKELDGMFFEGLFALRDKNGQLMHHDAITGTEKWFVSDFYIGELDVAMSKALDNTKELLSVYFSPTLYQKTGNVSYISTKVEGQIKKNEDTKIGFWAMNLLSWDIKEGVIELSVPLDDEVLEATKLVLSDFAGNSYPVVGVKSSTGNTLEVKGIVNGVPALGSKYYVLEINTKSSDIKEKKIDPKSDMKLENWFYQIFFDSSTGKIKQIVNKMTSKTYNLTVDFFYYTPETEGQASGAYIFRPTSPTPKQISETAKIIDYQSNEVFDSVTQMFSDYITVTTRLYKGKTLFTNAPIEIEFENIGVLPKDHEVVMRVISEIKNGKVVYHDDLGLEVKKKEYTTGKTQPTASNFYPTQYCSWIQDSEDQIMVLTQKSQAVASTEEGKMEFLLHRRCSKDDGRGVGQALEDTYVIKGFKMNLFIGKVGSLADYRRYHTYSLNFPIMNFPMLPQNWNIQQYPHDFRSSFKMINEPMCDAIHLLSFNKIYQDNDDFVIRFANIWEQFEGGETEAFEMVNVLNGLNLTSISPMTLSLMHQKSASFGEKDETVSLKPVEIKTFKVKIKRD